MRTLLLAITILSLMVCAHSQSAPSPSDDTSAGVQFKDGKVTLVLKDTPIYSALDQLCKAAGKSCSLSPNAAHVAKQTTGTVRVENATFEQALHALTNAASLSWAIENGIYVVYYPPTDESSANETPSSPDQNTDTFVRVIDGKVSLFVKDASILPAFDKLCKATGKTCSLTPGAAELARHLKANVRVEDADFEEALAALAHAIHCSWSIDQGAYQITFEQESGEPDEISVLYKYRPDLLLSRYKQTPSAPPEPKATSLQLMAMPVQEAYDAVIRASGSPDSLGWKFEGSLGKTTMPGAAFTDIPTKTAAAIVVAAAGLVPPSGSETAITRKGTTDVANYLSSNQLEVRGSSHPERWRSVAAYKASGGWKYFVDAKWVVPDLLKSILPANAGFVIEEKAGTGMPSVRLMNVTLDEALDAILGPTGYTYRVKSGVYTVSPAPAASGATAPCKTQAATKKPAPRAKGR